MTSPRIERLMEHIRDVPDFPKPGIMFKDITPLLGNGAAFREVTALLAERTEALAPDVIVAIESRGFLFGAALAGHLGLGIVPVRKPGKLPWRTARVEYALEYGTDALEIHADAMAKGMRAVIVDDVLATGGTAAATSRLVCGTGATVVGCAFVVELGFLEGRRKLADLQVEALIHY